MRGLALFLKTSGGSQPHRGRPGKLVPPMGGPVGSPCTRAEPMHMGSGARQFRVLV